MSSEAKESLSSVLARYVTQTRDTDFSPEVVHAFRRALVDYLACTLAGANLPVTMAVRRWAEAEGTRPVAMVIGSGQRLSALEAALVNGASAHGLDFDDGQTRGSVHPGGVIFSAAFAAAEKRGAGMREFMAGVIVGYDVLLRIASTMHPSSAKKGWHNTPVSGVFGAVAVASRIWGLDKETTQNALGIATSFAGGIREYLHDGAEVKRVHPGKAARDGLVCAGLAAEGVTGALYGFEGEDGLFRATVENRVDISQVHAGLGEQFLITTAYFKPYPCCRHFHAAIDAALDLRQEARLTSRDVKGVEIGIYGVGVHGHDHLTSRNLLEAQMSAPCAIASALINGRLGAAEFEPVSFEGAEPQRLLAATRTYVDEECERIYPVTRSGVVRLQLADGRTLERRVLDPRGEGEKPLTDDDLSRKFLDAATAALPPGRAEKLLEMLWAADATSDFAAICKILSEPAKQGVPA
jgi:2-methylcitrate dehydratase PrpD